MFKLSILVMITFSILFSKSLKRNFNCTTEPPDRPEQGTRIWSGDYRVSTKIIYTCGPYGQFLGQDDRLYPQMEVRCFRNRTWAPSSLDPCVMTSCGTIPIPPEDTNLVLTSGPQLSDSQLFSPSLPAVVKGLPIGMCSEDKFKVMIVGKILGDDYDKDIEIIVLGDDSTEAVHVRISIENRSVWMWSIVDNKATYGDLMKYDSGSINIDEYFVIK